MTRSDQTAADRIWREKLGQAGTPRTSIAALAVALAALLVLAALAAG